MWRKASIALATVVLAIAGAAVFFAPASVPITEDAFPDRTGIGIELPDAKYAVEQRVTEYWEDHLTPKITTSFFSSGEMGVYHHRNDGTIQVSELFYPENEDGTRQLKVHATVDIDGVTYLSDEAYFPDGKKQRGGMQRTDKSYQIITYFEDGLHVHMYELVGPKGAPLFQSISRLDGSLQQIAQQNEKSFDVTTYSEESLKMRTVAKASYWSKETTYYADGKTVRTEFLMESYKTIASYFAPDGKITQMREFDNWRMIATFYKDGVPSYRQSWRLLNKDAVKPEQVRNYSLMETAVLDAKGKATWRVTLNWTTGLPSMIEIGMAQASDDLVSEVTRKWYSEEGYLELLLVKKGEYGPEISRQEFTRADGIKPDAIPAYLTEPVPYEVPPKPVPPQQPSMYD